MYYKEQVTELYIWSWFSGWMPCAIQLFIMLINCGFQGGKDRVLEVPITWWVKMRAPIGWLAMRWSSFLPQELQSSTICRQEFCMPSVLCPFQVKSSRFQRFSEESVPFWDKFMRFLGSSGMNPYLPCPNMDLRFKKKNHQKSIHVILWSIEYHVDLSEQSSNETPCV